MKVRRLVPLGLAGLLLGVAGPVRAQESLLERVHASLPAADAVRVERIAREAEASGVPADLLYTKALEGAAKGVAAERIVAAVEGYATRLRQARGAVGPDADPPLLSVAAEALRRGVPAEAIYGLAHAHQGDLAIAVLVLGELAEAGIPVEHALVVVSEALERGHGDERLLHVSAEIRRRVRAGEPPDRAVAAGRALGLGLSGAVEGARGAHGRGRGQAGPPAGPPVPPGAGPPGQTKERPGRPR